MLVSSQISQVPSVQRLVNIWAARYHPNLSLLPLGRDAQVRSQFQADSSSEGRTQTAEKILTQILQRQCELAAFRTMSFYAPEGAIDYMEAARLAKSARQIYLKLLDVYQASSPIVISSRGNLSVTPGGASLEAWGIPKIDKLAKELEPLLLDLREQYAVSKNWQSVGFLTTQISQNNALLLEGLSATERVLISPYLEFLEEQVALPWLRVCAAAAKHSPDSPSLALVEKMLPRITQISKAVFEKWSAAFPTYASPRGGFDSPKVKHSSVRDFDMFQVYLWLCVLEGNLAFIEQELAAICVMVFGILNIPWTMTVEGTKLLINEILPYLEPHEQKHAAPYTQGMIGAFSDK